MLAPPPAGRGTDEEDQTRPFPLSVRVLSVIPSQPRQPACSGTGRSNRPDQGPTTRLDIMTNLACTTKVPYTPLVVVLTVLNHPPSRSTFYSLQDSQRLARAALGRDLDAAPAAARHVPSCPACLPACRRDRRIILEPHAHVACVAQPWNTLFHGTTTQHHHPCCPGGGTRVRRGLFEGMGGADRGGLPVGVGEREQYRPAIGPF